MTTQFNIKKAKREKIWTKVAIMGSSGSGKTYSALRLATGMLEKLRDLKMEQNGRILMINTEQKRGYYYANEFDYDVLDMDAPYSPESFVDAIRAGVDEEYPIIIVDSTSHEWEGAGGSLELHQRAGGRYQDWSKITPRHDRFITEIADSPVHIIATMRGKDQYSMDTDGGRTTVRKIGLGAKQREGFEYEFTTTFLVEQATNLATPQKDNTHIFEDETATKLSESHGIRIIEWANSGDGIYIPPKRYEKMIAEEEEQESAKSVDELKNRIFANCSKLGGSADSELMEFLKKYHPSGNPKRIEDLDTLLKLDSELEKMVNKKTKEQGE